MKYGSEYSIEIQLLCKENSRYVSEFHCGNSSIDSYFQKEASEDCTSVTYLFIDTDQDCLIACVTIACSAIFTDQTPMPQFSTILSAMEVKYLATNEQYQHIPYTSDSKSPSLSDCLFDYMISLMEEISHTKIGASKIVLYAVPGAINFYRRHGFKSFGDTMYGDEGYYLEGCEPMYFDMN